jgi:hypothetical protein
MKIEDFVSLKIAHLLLYYLLIKGNHRHAGDAVLQGPAFFFWNA